MTIHPLVNEEREQFNATHRIILTAADLAALAGGNGAQTIQTAVVGANAAANVEFVYLKTPFTFSDATLTSCAVLVGDSGSNNRFITSYETAGVANPVNTKGGVALNPKFNAYAAADQLAVVFTPTAGKNLNTALTGELHIYATLQNIIV